MSIANKLVKLGIAQKLLNEAKKPQNQQKAKDLFSQLSAKYKARKQPVSKP